MTGGGFFFEFEPIRTRWGRFAELLVKLRGRRCRVGAGARAAAVDVSRRLHAIAALRDA